MGSNDEKVYPLPGYLTPVQPPVPVARGGWWRLRSHKVRMDYLQRRDGFFATACLGAASVTIGLLITVFLVIGGVA